jgi:hypothetical protein
MVEEEWYQGEKVHDKRRRWQWQQPEQQYQKHVPQVLLSKMSAGVYTGDDTLDRYEIYNNQVLAHLSDTMMSHYITNINVTRQVMIQKPLNKIHCL